MKITKNYTGVRDWSLYDSDHTFLSLKEVAQALVQGMTGVTPSGTIILFGLEVSGAGPYTFTPGAIYSNGEIYICSGGSLASANPFLNLSETTSIYDPIIYDDGNSNNTWLDRIIVLAAAAGPTHFGQFNSLNRYIPHISNGWEPLNMDVGWSGQIYVRRIGSHVWFSGNVAYVSGGDVIAGGFPDLCKPVDPSGSNWFPILQRAVNIPGSGGFPEYQVNIDSLVGNGASGQTYNLTGVYFVMPEYR